MRTSLRAVALLGGGTVVSTVSALALAKLIAVLLGPEGVGMLGLFQGVIALGAILSSLGVNAGLVRDGARAIAAGDDRRLKVIRTATWLVFWCMCVSGTVLAFVFRDPLARFLFQDRGAAWWLAPVGLAALLTVAANLHMSLLNAFQNVAAVAKINIIASLVGAACGALLVVWRGGDAIVWVPLASAAVSCFVAMAFVPRALPPRAAALTPGEISTEARRLVHFGVPYALSALTGSGVQSGLPIIVLAELGEIGLGFFRAAASISISYLSVLTLALVQDYYPRLSAARSRAEADQLANEQFRLVLLIATPAVLCTSALAVPLLTLAFSARFEPATEVLRWLLLGDLFRFPGLVLSYALLVRSGQFTFLAVELAGGIAVVLGSWLGMRAFGLGGVGMGATAGQVVYLFVVFGVSRITKSGRVHGSVVRLFGVLATGVLAIRVAAFAGFDGVVLTGLTGVLAGLSGLFAWLQFRTALRASAPIEPEEPDATS